MREIPIIFNFKTNYDSSVSTEVPFKFLIKAGIYTAFILSGLYQNEFSEYKIFSVVMALFAFIVTYFNSEGETEKWVYAILISIIYIIKLFDKANWIVVFEGWASSGISNIIDAFSKPIHPRKNIV